MKKRAITIIGCGTLLLMGACGGSETATPANVDTPAQVKTEVPVLAVDPMVHGKEVYDRTCKACHQDNGAGIEKTFPPLAKSDFLVNKEQVIDQVINGKTGEMVVNGVTYNNAMPAQALNDEEIADVLTYVYNSFENTPTTITVAEVKAVRDKKK